LCSLTCSDSPLLIPRISTLQTVNHVMSLPIIKHVALSYYCYMVKLLICMSF
ncbi:hypothetical protein BJV78DRAFT_1253615, partial [Lactifluus subvellereus]